MNKYNAEEKALLDTIDSRLTLDAHLDNQCNILIEEIENHAKELIRRLKAEHEAGKKELRMAFEAKLISKKCKSSGEGGNASITVKVLAKSGPYEGTTWNLHPFEKGVCMLGRSTGKRFKDGGISLPKDKEISTTHAKIFISNGKIYFMDAGSTNGSLVNSEPAPEGAEFEVQNGMIITMGSSQLELQKIMS